MQLKNVFKTVTLSMMFSVGTIYAAAISDTVICAGVTTTVPEGAGEQAGFLAAFCPVNAPNVLVNLLEGDGSVSDQLWTQNGFFYFVSDDDPSTLVPNAVPTGFPFPPPNIFSVPEDGTLQDLSAFFGQAPGYVFVQSDVSTTPEPATMLLGAPALLLFGVRGLRRRKLSVR